MRAIVSLVGVFGLAVSCIGGGGSGGSDSGEKISSTISDSTLTSFDQTAGVAMLKPSFVDRFIASAHAIEGNINCFTGESVSFDMDIKIGSVTTNVQVDTKCGDDVELAIRRKMLESLDQHTMILEIVPGGMGGDDPKDYNLDFSTGSGFSFDTLYPTLEENVDATHDCLVDYMFKSNGKIVSSLSSAGTALQNNIDVNADGVGANCNVTPTEELRSADFRFKDGKIEFDESGTKNFSPKGCVNDDDDYKENGDGEGGCPDGYEGTYERWCIDDNDDGACDSLD